LASISPGSALGQSDAADNVSPKARCCAIQIPAAGNLDGDITIVEYFDYNCRIAQARAELRQCAGRRQGQAVYKDWRCSAVSIAAARCAGEKYQDKYVAATTR